MPSYRTQLFVTIPISTIVLKTKRLHNSITTVTFVIVNWGLPHRKSISHTSNDMFGFLWLWVSFNNQINFTSCIHKKDYEYFIPVVCNCINKIQWFLYFYFQIFWLNAKKTQSVTKICRHLGIVGKLYTTYDES